MKALIISDSNAKAMTIGGAVSYARPDMHWRSAHLGGFFLAPPKRGPPVDLDTLLPRLEARQRLPLNRLMSEAAEADVIYLALEDDGVGEHLARFLFDEIIDRSPDRLIHRVRLHRLAIESLAHAIEEPTTIDDDRVARQLATVAVDALVRHSSDERFQGGGRALWPALATVVALNRSTTTLQTDAGDFTAQGRVDDATSWVSQPLSVERSFETVRVPPPLPYDLTSLLCDASALLGIKAIEAWSIVRSLYEQGFVTCPRTSGRGFPPEFVSAAARVIGELAGPNFVGNPVFTDDRAIRPLSLAIEASEVPRPGRAIYRLLWARALTACSTESVQELTTNRVTVGSRAFYRDSWRVIEPGHSRVSLGLFRQFRTVPDVVHVRGIDGHAGATEHDVLAALSAFDNPAVVLRSLEHHQYVEYRGAHVVPREHVDDLLAEVRAIAPELCDLEFFMRTNRRLAEVTEATRRDTVEMYGRWLRDRGL